MTLWQCSACTTLYSPGAPRCPFDGATDYFEFGSTGSSVTVNEGPLSLLDPRVDCDLDGTGDQSSKVATAIALLPDDGGHIYQPPGVLRTGAIVLDRPVTWEGAGDGASIIKAASGFTGTLFTIEGTAPYSHIHDVAFDGGGVCPILVNVSSARTRMSAVHLTAAAAGTNGSALFLNGTNGTTDSAHAGDYTDVRIISCAGYGVFVKGFAYDNKFQQLWIGSCAVAARLENGNGFYSNCHFWGSTGNGIEVRADYNLFSNCYIETNGASGVNLFNAVGNRFAHCNIWANEQAGVFAQSANRTSVTDSIIWDNGTNGVQGVDSLHCKVRGCDFWDVTGTSRSQDRPVLTSGTSDKWIITENTMLTSEHNTGANSLVGSNNVVANNVIA